MPAYDAPRDPPAWRRDIYPQQHPHPSEPTGWQALQQHWLDQLHELRLFVAAQAREALLKQAHQYCTGLADWAGRSLLERIEYLHLPSPLMDLVTTAAKQQSHDFCSALVAQLHAQARALLAGVQQLWNGDAPRLAASTQPAASELVAAAQERPPDAHEDLAPLWYGYGPMQDMPPEAGFEVLLIGYWNDGGALLLP